MKICDIAQFYSPLSGGVKRYLADKQRFLAHQSGDHHVLIVPSRRTAIIREPAATRYEIASPRLIGSRSYRLLLARRQILEIVRRERPDLIEVGDPYRTAWIGLAAGRELGIPVVAFYHSDFPRALGRTAGRFAGGLIERTSSRLFQGYVVRLYNHMSATIVSSQRLCTVLDACGIKCLVHISLGTDVDVFHPHPSRDRIRAELGLTPDEKMVLFVGRLGREKNLRHLVAALKLLPSSCPRFRLVLVGDGELHDLVASEESRRLGVLWLPYCDSPQTLAEFYSAADLFIHPGRNETFGLVALEAQACGTPVLAVREGGVEDAIVDRPRRLARDGSPCALAVALDRYLRESDSPPQRAERRARVVRDFSTTATFTRITALYRHLIARRSVEDFAAEPASIHGLSRSSLPSR